ncbi:MAG: MFS transporter, partial [Acidobacteria bacterium]|nr:MFS transporter [Acidobacteriota bacterium]
QLSSVLAGGLSPLIATDLLRRTGRSWPIALYIAGMALITTIAVFCAAETAHSEIVSSKESASSPSPPQNQSAHKQ